MSVINNEIQRHGSAQFAEVEHLVRKRFYHRSPDALFLGFHRGSAIYWNGAGGGLLVAGARGGKLRDVLAYNVCAGICGGASLLVLDMKGELAAISQEQTPDQKFCYYWNPAALHNLPRHRVNPVDYIRIDSPSLVSDC